MFLDQSLMFLAVMDNDGMSFRDDHRDRVRDRDRLDIKHQTCYRFSSQRINGEQRPRCETVEKSSPMNRAINRLWLFRDCPLPRGC